MAHSSSSKKRIRQNEKSRLRNKAEKSRLRTYLKKFEKALTAGEVAPAEQVYREAASFLDKASKHGVIHDNQASRRKSRMQVRLNQLIASKKS